MIREEMENYVVTFHTFTSDKIGLKSKKIRKVISGKKTKITQQCDLLAMYILLLFTNWTTPWKK